MNAKALRVRWWKWLVALVAIALLLQFTLAGCGSEKEESLVGTQWTLTSLRGEPLLADTPITIEFGEKWLSGFAGCNGYGGGPDSGKYETSLKGVLSVPVVAITLQKCLSPEGVMEQEKAYVSALNSVTNYRVADDRLELQDAGGQTVLVYVRQPD